MADEKADTGGEFADPPATGNDFPQLNASRLVTDVRAGDHDGFSRLVIEFGDDEKKDSRVGYSVEYVDEAVSDGKGDPIEVDGDKTIDIQLSGVKMPEGSDPQPFGRIDGTSAFKQIESIGPFEGMSQIVIGLDSQGPVRVTELQDPYRIVVDVKTK
ncbi:hypothetical protein BSZ39_08880 [Bowdeniella nasicola]|uniref:AMIN-like domain-containing protein n=1 Tax=Bowdeniella nasicola TaxID=208480 RepID=A0A1Q5Q102_9ACTO|nr:hypothetical protein BSZ39_08880 [Bowdeniella nasicola]